MEEIRRRLRTHYKFLIVRHPFERLYSAYYDKFVVNYKRFGMRWYGNVVKKVFPDRNGSDAANYLLFDDFVKMLLDGGECSALMNTGNPKTNSAIPVK